jgi:hypothetical protein
VGLVARQIEASGIPTICLSSAFSITAAVNPPRAVFIDFPLGHTAGEAQDVELQRSIMLDTLDAAQSISRPGEIRTLPYRWSDGNAWKEAAMRTGADDRTVRDDEPQYQYPEDRAAADRSRNQTSQM